MHNRHRSSAESADPPGKQPRTSFGRFEPRSLVRRRGDYCVIRAWSSERRENVLLVAGESNASVVTRRRLAALGAAHADFIHPGVARTIETDVAASAPFVAFAVDAAIDLETVLEAWSERSERIPYRWSTALADALGEIWASLMESPGQPTLGAIALANFVVTESGSIHVIGLGDNVLGLRDDGRPTTASSTWMSMSVELGAPAGGFDDALAFQRMLRSFTAIVDLPAPLARVLSNRSGPLDVPLARTEEWVARRLFDGEARSTSGRRALGTLRQFWGMIDASPDAEGLRAELATIAERAATRTGAERTHAVAALAVDRARRLVMASPDGAFAFDRKPVLWRLLAALVDARIASPGRAFDADAVYRMGWADERARPASVLNRVYVAIATLRSSGMREHLVHDGRGYLLDPRREILVDGERIAAVTIAPE